MAQGIVTLSAPFIARVGAQNVVTRLTAAGFTDPGTGAAPAIIPTSQPNAGGIIHRPPTPREAPILALLAQCSTSECLATECMTLVAMQLAADRHHVDPSNKQTMNLLDDSPLDWAAVVQAVAAVDGGSRSDIQINFLHRAVHAMDTAPLLTWATSTHAAEDVRGLGMEALSVRLPVDCPSGHAVSARAAVIDKYAEILRSTGGRPAVGQALSFLQAIAALAYSTRETNEAAVAAAVAQTDALGSFAAGFVSGYYESAKMGEHSTVKANSVLRLKVSHTDYWARGTAQGESSQRAYSAKGVQYALPGDVPYTPVNNPAIDAAVAGAPAPFIEPAPRAPATEARLDSVRDAHQALTQAHQVQAAAAIAAGQPAPAPPGPKDYSACF